MTAPAQISSTDTAALLAQHETDIIYVKNTLSGPTVFTADATRADGHVTWQGAGDLNGQDIQVVPKGLLGNVQFRRNIQLGILQIVEDPILAEAALAAQQDAWTSQESRRRNVDPNAIFGEDGKPQQLVMEKADQNDMLVLDCLQKSQGCDQRVSVRRNEAGVKPPLCSQHFGLAGLYVSIEDHESPLIGGKAQFKWIRPQIG